MTSLQPPATVIASLNFTGGFPVWTDFAPSLVVTLAVGSLPVPKWYS